MLWPWMLLGEGIGVCLIAGAFLAMRIIRTRQRGENG